MIIIIDSCGALEWQGLASARVKLDLLMCFTDAGSHSALYYAQQDAQTEATIPTSHRGRRRGLKLHMRRKLQNNKEHVSKML